MLDSLQGSSFLQQFYNLHSRDQISNWSWFSFALVCHGADSLLYTIIEINIIDILLSPKVQLHRRELHHLCLHLLILFVIKAWHIVGSVWVSPNFSIDTFRHYHLLFLWKLGTLCRQYHYAEAGLIWLWWWTLKESSLKTFETPGQANQYWIWIPCIYDFSFWSSAIFRPGGSHQESYPRPVLGTLNQGLQTLPSGASSCSTSTSIWTIWAVGLWLQLGRSAELPPDFLCSRSHCSSSPPFWKPLRLRKHNAIVTLKSMPIVLLMCTKLVVV